MAWTIEEVGRNDLIDTSFGLTVTLDSPVPAGATVLVVVSVGNPNNLFTISNDPFAAVDDALNSYSQVDRGGTAGVGTPAGNTVVALLEARGVDPLLAGDTVSITIPQTLPPPGPIAAFPKLAVVYVATGLAAAFGAGATHVNPPIVSPTASGSAGIDSTATFTSRPRVHLALMTWRNGTLSLGTPTLTPDPGWTILEGGVSIGSSHAPASLAVGHYEEVGGEPSIVFGGTLTRDGGAGAAEAGGLVLTFQVLPDLQSDLRRGPDGRLLRARLDPERALFVDRFSDADPLTVEESVAVPTTDTFSIAGTRLRASPVLLCRASGTWQLFYINNNVVYSRGSRDQGKTWGTVVNSFLGSQTFTDFDACITNGVCVAALYRVAEQTWYQAVGVPATDTSWTFTTPVVLIEDALPGGRLLPEKDGTVLFSYIDLDEDPHIIRCRNVKQDGALTWESAT